MPRGKKLGLLLSGSPQKNGFQHGIALAHTAQKQGVQVYLYCIDDAVSGIGDPRIRALQDAGGHVYACAYSAERRRIPVSTQATFGGLTILSDLIAGTDRFLHFR